MSTRSSERNLFSPLDNPELTIQRRSRADPTLLNVFKMAAEGNGDLPVPDLQTMNIKVNRVTDDALPLYLFPHSLTHHATTWFDRLPRNSINTFEQMAKMFLALKAEMAEINKNLMRVLQVNQQVKAVTPNCETCGGPHSFNDCPATVGQTHNVYDFMKMNTASSLGLGTLLGNTITNPKEDLKGITTRSGTAYQGPTIPTTSSSLPPEVELIAPIIEPVASPVSALKPNQKPSILYPSRLHDEKLRDKANDQREKFFQIFKDLNFNISFADSINLMPKMAECLALVDLGARINLIPLSVWNKISLPDLSPTCMTLELTDRSISHPVGVSEDVFVKVGTFHFPADFVVVDFDVDPRVPLILGRSFLKTRRALIDVFEATVGQTHNVYDVRAYQGNTITNPNEELKGITTSSGTAYQGPTIPTTSSSIPSTESPILNSKPVVAPIIEPVAAPVSALKPNQRPSIPYPSRLHDQKLRDKANDQREKFFQIFKDLNFNINFADTLILMPKFGPTIKTLLIKKDKLSELARTKLNEHCSAVLLKKFLEKLRDPGKFLISCDFPEMAECLALADLDASINLMPLSVWNKLSLPNLSPTYFDADPRVPLIPGRYFLKTGRALIDVFKGELTLRVGKEAITFNLDQTSRYPANYNYMMANRIDVIDMASEEYSQEVLGFFDVIASGNPTPYYDPIVSTTSPTLTPFGESDFLLEEVDSFLALEDDPTSPKVDHYYVDTKGDILLLEAFLNDDPSLPPPNQGNYLPQV
nr:reverse transcriptase domain-containing protein [Tanacetum cinerariifolium]